MRLSPELFHHLIPPSAHAQTFCNSSGGGGGGGAFFRLTFSGEKVKNTQPKTQCETETDGGGERERKN